VNEPNLPTLFLVNLLFFLSTRLKNILIKIWWLVARKLVKVTNWSKVSHHYGSKKLWSEFHDFWHENSPYL